MSQLCEYHKELTDGVGKCSVPVWDRGWPDGFCDANAFGKRLSGSSYEGYVPALACPKHGGPKEIIADPTTEPDKPSAP